MSTSTTQTPTKEFEAIQTVYGALEPLDSDGKQRVINYIVSLFSLDSIASEAEEKVVEEDPTSGASIAIGTKFDSLAELYDAATPVTNADKALVVGVWLQENVGHDSFSSQAINTELKHLGYGIANITSALDQLKEMKPAYIHQLRKSGSSQQARKTYKVTVAGIRAVRNMIAKSQGSE